MRDEGSYEGPIASVYDEYGMESEYSRQSSVQYGDRNSGRRPTLQHPPPQNGMCLAEAAVRA